MTRCYYDRSKRLIRIEGHAMFAPAGEDIVCAGVSALECALYQYLTDVMMDGVSVVKADLEPSSSRFVGCEKTDEAFECIWAGLELIAQNYPSYVQCWRG